MYKILLLEDDELLALSMDDFLKEEGYLVDLVFNGQDAIDLSYKKNYDLYLLDINVPNLNGLEVLKNLRLAGDNTPCMFLTSYKDKETLKKAFISGCDDYLKKPVDLEELLLRINSLFKRAGKQLEDLTISDCLIYKASKKRLFKNNVDLNLPIKVLSLFELCLENRGDIITKEMIISRLWSFQEDASEGSLRVYINTLKKILGKNSISNIKSIGYKVEF